VRAADEGNNILGTPTLHEARLFFSHSHSELSAHP
jgi:hypothetical protein